MKGGGNFSEFLQERKWSWWFWKTLLSHFIDLLEQEFPPNQRGDLSISIARQKIVEFDMNFWWKIYKINFEILQICFLKPDCTRKLAGVASMSALFSFIYFFFCLLMSCSCNVRTTLTVFCIWYKSIRTTQNLTLYTLILFYIINQG